MTLVDRVSVFFLGALAVILVGYSSVLYYTVQRREYHEFDQRLQSALYVLTAAIEVEQDDVKWQRSDHTIHLGDKADEVHWFIAAANGRVVDCSRNLDRIALPDSPIYAALTTEPSGQEPLPLSRGPWRTLRVKLIAPEPKHLDEREPDEFDALDVVVALNRTGLESDLRQLAALVCLVPLSFFLAAAAIGRWYCRRALAPVQEMAAQARPLRCAGFDLRLPVPPRRDELADLAVAFNALLDELQVMFQRQQRFTSDAAHQLRTPLTILRGQLDVALRRERTDEEYRDVLYTLRDETEELQGIVEVLLFLARSDDETRPPQLNPLYIDEWLDDYAIRWKTHARAGDLQFDCRNANAAVLASSALLTQLLDVLVHNALKYSDPGTPVTVTSQGQHASVVLSVVDQGIGIAREEREAIFEPFYRSPAARQTGRAGTGLGLAIAARIASTLHGTIECRAAEPPGSCFLVSLPATEQNRDDERAERPAGLRR